MHLRAWIVFGVIGLLSSSAWAVPPRVTLQGALTNSAGQAVSGNFPVVVALYSAADMFVCPSVYEPFGIINLEAMACETPVVATAVGGIPEVVVHEETGLLVPFESGEGIGPLDADAFERELAAGIDRLAGDPELAKRFGAAGRQRAEDQFSWESVARKTLALYRKVGAPTVPA